MYKTLSVIIMMLLGVGLSSPISAKEDRDLDNFSSISVATGIEVTLIQGSETKAIVETKNITEDEVITKVENGNLKIKFKSHFNLGKQRKAYVTVYFKDMDEIEASSGSTIKNMDKLEFDKLEIEASSGASIRLNFEASKIDVNASSGASIVLDGSGDRLKVSASSGASIKADSLEINEVDATGSSGASISVWAEDYIAASASSGASIRYKGDPKKTNIEKTYSGSISEMK